MSDYNTIIYDIEVFKEDWIVVFKPITDKDCVVIHNNIDKLREYIVEHSLDIFCGFNNKWYDDWIILTMYLGGSNEIVKEHNDFIVQKQKNGWEFHFIKYQKKPFISMDLRDDLDKGLSLKAIEGNMLENIVESSVPFDIDRALTESELQESIKYCITDVLNTEKLYYKRKDYIESKINVGKLKDLDERKCLSMTNAKLTAYYLGAQKQLLEDEFVYTIPKEVVINKYPQVLEFFKNPQEYTITQLEKKLETTTRKVSIKSIQNKIEKIKNGTRYDCDLETIIANAPHTYGWGGLHGALKNCQRYESDNYKMLNIDVGSYYPSLVLQYGYASRNIPDADGYKNVYDIRLNAKHSGDKATANALKLVLNTFYGAMKNQYNDLFDPRNASAVCITGMLLLTMLIEWLEDVPTFELIQSNTDGILIGYNPKYEDEIINLVMKWESQSRMNMEYTYVHKYVAKDVNNYVMEVGQSFIIKDNNRVIVGEDTNAIKCKGGWVSQYKGGSFRMNSMSILSKALVNYFMNDIPIETTINDCDDISQFQIIAKTGGTYDKTIWMVEDKPIEINRCNRVYASKNNKFGLLYKVKGKSKTKIDLPTHCIVDNEGELKIKDIDKQYYIDLANERIKKFIGRKKPKLKSNDKEEIKVMATKETNIYEKLTAARLDFLKANVKKTGKNRHLSFMYYTLDDIVPIGTEVLAKHGLLNYMQFANQQGVATITDGGETSIHFTAPFMMPTPILNKDGVAVNNVVQDLGSSITYLRRYLWMLVLDITEHDDIDGDEPVEEPKKAKPKKAKTPLNEKEKEEVKEEVIAQGKDEVANKITIKAIKNGLKKIRDELETDNEAYIISVLEKLNDGISEIDAQAILVEISTKLEGE